MKRKILAMILVCLCLLVSLSLMVSAGTHEIIIQGRTRYMDPYQTIRNDNPDTNYPGIVVQANQTDGMEWRGLVYVPLITNLSNVTKVELALRTFSLTGGGGIMALHSINEQWDKPDVTWNDRKSAQAWSTPGGVYEAVPADTQMVDSNNQWYYWNITTYYFDFIGDGDAKDHYGFILIYITPHPASLAGAAFQSLGDGLEDYYPKYIYTVENTTEPAEAGSSDVTKDVWNLKGFANLTHKLASTIYGEISNTTALCWRNATSGYYYTYWPALGMLEDEYLEFGDGLFILTDTNTTWNHT